MQGGGGGGMGHVVPGHSGRQCGEGIDTSDPTVVPLPDRNTLPTALDVFFENLFGSTMTP